MRNNLSRREITARQNALHEQIDHAAGWFRDEMPKFVSIK
jgi:hypothetical protein